MNRPVDWNDYYDILCQVQKTEGTINVPIKYEYDGIAIGRWLARQRNIHSIGKMPKDRQEKLEALGIIWNANELRLIKRKEEWFDIFRLAESYYKENGHLRIPDNYIINGINVGRWLQNLKSAYKGYAIRKIALYQINALETIGIEWDYNYLEEQWNSMYALACTYYKEHGDLEIAQEKEYQGRKLGSWIHQQRQVYRNGKLSEEKKAKLDSISMIWFPQIHKWDTYYEYAEKYYKEIGNLDVPDGFIIDGIKLGRWIGVQRQSYNWRQDTILTQERIDRLNKIGMIWKGVTNMQTSFYEQIIYYYVKKLFPKTVNRYNELGFEIDVYIPELKIGFEYDGYFWHKDRIQLDVEKNKKCSDAGIILIRIREKGLSSIIGSINYILKDDRIETFMVVLSSIFVEHLKRSLKSNIQKDAFKIVKQYKVTINSPWYRAYKEALHYYQTFGNLLVPDKYITQNGIKLGRWIQEQRQSFKNIHNNPLSDEKIFMLNKLGMVWDVLEYRWNIGYKYAEAYYKEFGKLDMPQSFLYNGFRLGKWVHKQREIHRRSTRYSDEHKRLLDSIGMAW